MTKQSLKIALSAVKKFFGDGEILPDKQYGIENIVDEKSLPVNCLREILKQLIDKLLLSKSAYRIILHNRVSKFSVAVNRNINRFYAFARSHS